MRRRAIESIAERTDGAVVVARESTTSMLQEAWMFGAYTINRFAGFCLNILKQRRPEIELRRERMQNPHSFFVDALQFDIQDVGGRRPTNDMNYLDFEDKATPPSATAIDSHSGFTPVDGEAAVPTAAGAEDAPELSKSAPVPIAARRAGGPLDPIVATGSPPILSTLETFRGRSYTGSSVADSLKDASRRGRAERVHRSDRLNTGFLEDMHIGCLVYTRECFDRVRAGLRACFHTLAHLTFMSAIALLFRLVVFYLNPVYLIFILLRALWSRVVGVARSSREALATPSVNEASAGLDARSMQEIVTSAGYPVKTYDVVTSDGYIIQITRLPRPEAKHAIYFQHGVFDSAFAWVANGSIGSLAFRAYDLGYDIWMGNFRGTTLRRHTNPNITPAEYWAFSVNEHAFCDIAAFVKFIDTTKRGELSGKRSATFEMDMESHTQPQQPYTLTSVSHSMGAAATIMYIVHSRMNNRPHNLTSAVMLSPAGYHKLMPALCRVTGPIIEKTIAKQVYSFRFPSEMFRKLAAKVIQDIRNSPATSELVTFLVASFLGGQKKGAHPFEFVHNLPYNTFAGTPVGVFNHFMQMGRAVKFQAFDYGPEGNMKHYGQATPIDFFAHYDKFDIPARFVMGLRDNLIEPENVLKHFHTLSKVQPNLAYLKTFDCGHIDFTLGLNDDLISYIISVLPVDEATSAVRPVVLETHVYNVHPQHAHSDSSSKLAVPMTNPLRRAPEGAGVGRGRGGDSANSQSDTDANRRGATSFSDASDAVGNTPPTPQAASSSAQSTPVAIPPRSASKPTTPDEERPAANSSPSRRKGSASRGRGRRGHGAEYF